MHFARTPSANARLFCNLPSCLTDTRARNPFGIIGILHNLLYTPPKAKIRRNTLVPSERRDWQPLSPGPQHDGPSPAMQPIVHSRLGNQDSVPFYAQSFEPRRYQSTSLVDRLACLDAAKTLCSGGGIGMSPFRSFHRNWLSSAVSTASAWLKSRFSPSFHSSAFI